MTNLFCLKYAQDEATSIGIDPGANGAAACVTKKGETWAVDVFDFKKNESNGPSKLLRWMLAHGREHVGKLSVTIEKVHSTPQMGVVSAFTFGRNCGWLHAVIDISGYEFTQVTPQRWQGDCNCRTGGVKTVTHRAASEIVSSVDWVNKPPKVTHANADAIIIACWGLPK